MVRKRIAGFLIPMSLFAIMGWQGSPVEASSDVFLAETTAYYAGPESTGKGPGHPAYGITKSGISVFENPYVVAANPEFLPQGSLLFIEGIGYRLVADTGSYYKNPKWAQVIDIYFPTLEEAVRYGRQHRMVVVLRRGWDNWTSVRLDRVLPGEARRDYALPSGMFFGLIEEVGPPPGPPPPPTPQERPRQERPQQEPPRAEEVGLENERAEFRLPLRAGLAVIWLFVVFKVRFLGNRRKRFDRASGERTFSVQ